MDEDKRITIINLHQDEWVRWENPRFRFVHTSDSHVNRSRLLIVRAEDYREEQPGLKILLLEVMTKCSAFIGGLALSKPVYYSALRLIELTR